MANAAYSDLIKNLRFIDVGIGDLILDPNNPRFSTHATTRVPEEQYGDANVVARTIDRMTPPDDPFRIQKLMASIRSNGWNPVDQIFVRKHEKSSKYVVLEGNRRVTAITKLLNDDTEPVSDELRRQLSTITVALISQSGSDEDFYRQITYLLGVRHLGSLRAWSPFAQAKTTFRRFLQRAGIAAEDFRADEALETEISKAISTDRKRVNEQLRVYRVMSQLDDVPAIRMAGGMRPRYYSICRDAVVPPRSSQLHNYIVQDPDTYLLNPESIVRMDSLCYFSTPKERDAAPVNVPAEWRKLDKILKEENVGRREEMIDAVEKQQRRPSLVWSDREEEMNKPRWDVWLRDVAIILGSLRIGEDFDSPEAKDVGKRLVSVVSELTAKTEEANP